MNLGDHVRKALREQSMSQSDLARALDVLPQQVYKWCRAKNLTTDAIQRITAVLHVPEFDDLLDDPTVTVAGVQMPRSVARTLEETDPALVRELLLMLQQYRKSPPEVRRAMINQFAASRGLFDAASGTSQSDDVDQS